MYKVLVCGSREYSDRDSINRILDSLLARKGSNLLILTGGAVGADELARQWATSRKVDHRVMYANWETEGKSAGPKRNQRMLDSGPKLVLAFRVTKQGANRGTNHMVDIAKAAGIKVKSYT